MIFGLDRGSNGGARGELEGACNCLPCLALLVLGDSACFLRVESKEKTFLEQKMLRKRNFGVPGPDSLSLARSLLVFACILGIPFVFVFSDAD